MNEFERETDCYDKTLALAGRLARACGGGSALIALCGGMGSGKTAFARGMAMALGESGACSPTFAIVNEYRGKMLHFDLYRLKSAAELYETGYDWDCYDGIVAMEWADLFEAELPPDRLTVSIEPLAQDRRRFTFVAGGERSQEILARLIDDYSGD